MQLDLQEWISKRAVDKGVLGRELNDGERKIAALIVSIAEEISPTVLFRTPTVIGAVVMATLMDRNMASEGNTPVAPEAYIPEIAERFSELESKYLSAGRQVHPIVRRWERLKDKWRGLVSRLRG